MKPSAKESPLLPTLSVFGQIQNSTKNFARLDRRPFALPMADLTTKDGRLDH